MSWIRALQVLCVAGLVAASCAPGSDGDAPGDRGVPSAPRTAAPDGAGWESQPCLSPLPSDEPEDGLEQAKALKSAVGVTPITDDLDQPTAVALRCGDDDTIYVAEKAGVVLAVRDGALADEPVLDLTDVVNDTGLEQGLLGLTFSPDGKALYVDFTGSDDEIRIVEFTADETGAFARDTARELLVIPHPDPEPVHQAGHLTFGPDGLLYVAVGDGGPGQREEAQNVDSLYGGILRIDPGADGDASYAVPEDNPLVGDDTGRPELWTWGLRNPWRFSFDRANADLWIGDVGDLYWEEISMVPFEEAPGANFGWPAFEGTHPHQPEVDLTGNHRGPVYDYAHPAGCGVIGGHVYRGSEIPDLRGAYVFGDLCTGRVDAVVLDDADRVVARVPLTGFEGGGQAIAFAEEPNGELLVTTFEPGALWRIEAADSS